MHYLDPQFIVETLGLIGVVSIIFAESGLFFGFFLPGDSLLFTAGLLASQNFLSIQYLVIFGIIAAIAGDSVGYAFGKKVGPKIFTKEDSLIWNKKHIEKSRKFFEKYGPKAIILARFMPIVRTFTPILAGVGTMEYKLFLRYNIIGGVLWVASMSIGGYFFGKLIPNPDKYLLPIIGLIIFLSILPGILEFIKSRKNK
ncbi:MAG: rane-associated protein [Patescibacteria group bacterium]|nr:rane-associated protein [Patescibacteria group bacterium]